MAQNNENIGNIGSTLRRQLELPKLNYDAEQSEFFKRFYEETYHEYDPMTTEIDVIRKTEGW